MAEQFISETQYVLFVINIEDLDLRDSSYSPVIMHCYKVMKVRILNITCPTAKQVHGALSS